MLTSRDLTQYTLLQSHMPAFDQWISLKTDCTTAQSEPLRNTIIETAER